MLHRLNIIDNTEHEIIENNKSLTFVMTNSGRPFFLNNKDAIHIDYDIIDRILKGICVDSKRF